MNVVDERTLGQRLQNARQQAGLTQQELCQRAQLSYSTLAKIERGAIKSPSIFTIKSIADVLGTTLDMLIGGGIPSTTPVLKKSKAGVSFVYFDINGCLVRFFHGAFSQLAADTGASSDLIETTFWHYNDAVCRGEISLEQFNTLLAKELGVSTIDWQHYYIEAIDPITEMAELVRWASSIYKVGLLSNIMPGFIEEMLSRGILPKINYSAIIDSSVVHAIKPEDQVYSIAADKAGVAPSEILLIDDSRANLMAAERLGWHVLWFDDFSPVESVTRVREALEPEE